MSKVTPLTKYLVLCVAVIGIVGCDRVSKRVASEALSSMPTQSYLFDVVRLSYAENPGSFLSLGAKLRPSVRFALFTLGSGALLSFLVVYAVRHRWSGLELLGLAVLVAGGASNWADRLTDGRVVDFLNIGVGPIRTGIFNVADIAVSAGVVILLFSEYSRRPMRRRAAEFDRRDR